MDLREFYLENIKPDEYYYKFFDLIDGINKIYNIFLNDYEEIGDFQFIVFDEQECIDKFKSLCMPRNNDLTNEEKCWFYLTLYFLYKNGYTLQNFPNLVKRPPSNVNDFVYNDIRNFILVSQNDGSGVVRWADRRLLVSSFKFNKIDDFIELPEDLDSMFIKISTRNASFENMALDEKICYIANLIEYMLKVNDSFITIDYSSLCFDYINDDFVKKYRKQIQCFRHSSDSSLVERDNYNDEQKKFFVDLGIIIIKSIHYFIKNS